MIFATFFGDKSRHDYEHYDMADYIVDSSGYETVPQIMARLIRGELVNPKPMQYDDESSDDAALDNVRDIPEIEDITDVTDVADQLADMAERQRELKQNDTAKQFDDEKSEA